MPLHHLYRLHFVGQSLYIVVFGGRFIFFVIIEYLSAFFFFFLGRPRNRFEGLDWIGMEGFGSDWILDSASRCVEWWRDFLDDSVSSS